MTISSRKRPSPHAGLKGDRVSCVLHARSAYRLSGGRPCAREDRDARPAVFLGPSDADGRRCRDCLPSDRRNTVHGRGTARPSTRPDTAAASSSRRATCSAIPADSSSPRPRNSRGRVGAARGTSVGPGADRCGCPCLSAPGPPRQGRGTMPR